jgi:hypothetical protein
MMANQHDRYALALNRAINDLLILAQASILLVKVV